jgi:hypothetical protein
MTHSMSGTNMSDLWQHAIRVIGERADIALAESDLAGVFGQFLGDDSLTITTHSDGATYRASHPTPLEGLEDVFRAHPTLIILSSFETPKNNLIWECVKAYGYIAEQTVGRYELNSNIPLEETQLIWKFFGRYLNPATRPTSAQVMAEFGASTEKLLEKRKARQEKEAAAKALADKHKPSESP